MPLRRVPGDGLRRGRGRRREDDHAIGGHRRLAGPLERHHAAQRPPRGEGHPLHAEVGEERDVGPGQVCGGEEGEGKCGIPGPGGGPGRAVTTAQQVGRHDRPVRRVERPAGFKERPPPAVHFVAAGEGMKDQRPAPRAPQGRVAVDPVPEARVGKDLAPGGGEVAEVEVRGHCCERGNGRHRAALVPVAAVAAAVSGAPPSA